MATENPTYDLMLLLDATTEDDRKAKILSDTEQLIAREGGEVVSKHDWGLRPTAYEIDKKTEAEYHLIQLHGGRDLLVQLDRVLRITDDVQRFRIIKLAKTAGAPPDLTVSAAPPAPAAAAPSSQDEDIVEPEPEPTAEAEPAVAPAS